MLSEIHSSKGRPAARRPLTRALLLAGVLALIASGAPAAWAGPAEEEYKLTLPGARGDDSSSPGETRSRLDGWGGTAATGAYPGRGSGSGGSGSVADGPYGSGGFGNGEASSDGYDPLLAKAREGDTDSGLLSATSAAGKTPAGLAVLAALLLITLAGIVAVRRSRRAKGATWR